MFLYALRTIKRISGTVHMTVIALACLSVLLTGNGAAAEDDATIWPVRARHAVTSSFGEPRPGRFHMGLDFKSDGVSGRKVYAVDDGFISRVRTTPFGYGKVLYQKLDDGRTIVYAHMQGFTPEIEARLFKLRIDRKTYDVDWYPQPGEIRFSLGDVIGQAGNSGTVGPHLHLEVRDSDNLPMNPLFAGFDIPDTTPPEIMAVALIPLDHTSSVDGAPVARWLDLTAPSAEPPVCSGRIGVAVSVFDRTDTARNQLGVFRLSLAVDGDPVFAKTYDSISYNLYSQGAFDYLPGAAFGGDGTLSVLFREVGNRLDFYEGDGIVSCTLPGDAGTREVAVVASDFPGNETVAAFDIVTGQRPQIMHCALTEDTTLRVTGRGSGGVMLTRLDIKRSGDDGWRLVRSVSLADTILSRAEPLPDDDEVSHLRITVTDANGLRSMPVHLRSNASDSDTMPVELTVIPTLMHDRIAVRITSSETPSALPVVQVEVDGVLDEALRYPVAMDSLSWVAAVPLPPTGAHTMRIKATTTDGRFEPVWDFAELRIASCDTADSTVVTSRGGSLRVTVPASSLIRPAPVAVDSAGVRATERLVLLSDGYRVIHGDVPGGGPFRAEIELDREPPSTAGIYGSDDGRKWSWLSGERAGMIMTGAFDGTTILAVLDDRHPPYVKPDSPKPNSSTTNRRPLLRARLEDRGSGIEGSSSIEFSIDGIPVYGEYEPNSQRVSYRPHNPLSPGSHTVRITARDLAGHTTEKSWTFTVR
jgi:hypothetical protein